MDHTHSSTGGASVPAPERDNSPVTEVPGSGGVDSVSREDQAKPSIVSLDKAAKNPNAEAGGVKYYAKVLRVKLAACLFFCSIIALVFSILFVLGGERSAVWFVALLAGGLVAVDLFIRKHGLVKGEALSATWAWIDQESERLGCGRTFNFCGTIEAIGGGFQYDAGYIAGSIRFSAAGKNQPILLKNVMVPSLLESLVRVGSAGRFFVTRARGNRCILFAVEANGSVQEACEQANAICVDVQSEEMRNPDSPTRRALRSPGMIVFLPILPVLFLIPVLVKHGGAPSPAGLRRYLKRHYEVGR